MFELYTDSFVHEDKLMYFDFNFDFDLDIQNDKSDILTHLSCSSGCRCCWPDWPDMPPEAWSRVLAARALDIAVAIGAGLGGPKLVEDSWPWFVLPW